MSDKTNEDPKLIIDEDWKTQVQREKEELKHQQAQAANSQVSETDAAGTDAAGTDETESDPRGGGLGDVKIVDGDVSRPERSGDESVDAATSADDSPGDANEEFGGPPPPATLMLLANTLATQAMGAMGLIADESGEPIPANFDFARHFIDMLAVLEEKTKGNVSDEEAAFLKEAQHQLRLAFVAVSKKQS